MFSIGFLGRNIEKRARCGYALDFFQMLLYIFVRRSSKHQELAYSIRQYDTIINNRGSYLQNNKF